MKAQSGQAERTGMKKIKIRDITPGGLHIEDTIDQSVFEQSEDDYIRFIQPLTVKAVVKKFESTVLCDVEVKTRFATFCSRSLEKLERDWGLKFSVDYEIEPYQETVDLEDDVRQEVLLQLPVRILSDAEAAKEAQEKKEEPPADRPPENTYKPFTGLKDLE